MTDIHKASSLPEYTSFEEKKESFDVRIVDNINQLNTHIEFYSDKDYLFRGVNSWKYKMLSSYHRYLHLTKYPWFDERSIEDSKLLNAQIDTLFESNDFKEHCQFVAEMYIEDKERILLNNVIERNFFLTMSKLQHYENKSFLIDFTEDPFVALWFAIYDNKEEDERISLIAFPKNRIRYLSLDPEQDKYKAFGSKERLLKNISNPEYMKIQLGVIEKMLWFSAPVVHINYEDNFIKNARQEAQKGSFIAYSPPMKSGNYSDEGLENLLINGHCNPVNHDRTKPISLEISNSKIPEIEDILKQKGINKESLFV